MRFFPEWLFDVLKGSIFMGTHRRRRMPYPELVRWLAICLPVGLYHLWNERYRWHWAVKLGISALATGFAICLYTGVISLFSTPSPVMAQSSPVQLSQRDIYPLVVDADGVYYHLQGCVHADRGALAITLVQAARQGIPPDEACNPPRYSSRY